MHTTHRWLSQGTNLASSFKTMSQWDAKKPGLWTLDSIMDSIIGLDFRLSGVKGYSAAKLYDLGGVSLKDSSSVCCRIIETTIFVETVT